MTEKRHRWVYYAVTRDKVMSETTEKKFKEMLANHKPRDILFACRGLQLDIEFNKQPSVELSVNLKEL